MKWVGGGGGGGGEGAYVSSENCRVKSGKFGHQVNLETYFQTVSHQDFHCLLSLFYFYSNHSKVKETMSLSEFR